MNYWPADPANIAECFEPLIALLEDVAETGAAMAKAHYGARGWVPHHNTDLWRATGTDRRTAMGHVADRRRLALRQLWEHYDFDGDEALARAASIRP